MLIQYKITTMYRSITLSSYIVGIWCKIYAPMVCVCVCVCGVCVCVCVCVVCVCLDTKLQVHASILAREVCA